MRTFPSQNAVAEQLLIRFTTNSCAESTGQIRFPKLTMSRNDVGNTRLNADIVVCYGGEARGGTPVPS